jgi:hypothetical protein
MEGNLSAKEMVLNCSSPYTILGFISYSLPTHNKGGQKLKLVG